MDYSEEWRSNVEMAARIMAATADPTLTERAVTIAWHLVKE